MEARDVALALARGRIAIGAAFALAPGSAGRLWIGGDASRPAVKIVTRALGARDMALGLGTVIALDRGAPVRGWLEASTLADAADLVGTLLAGNSISPTARRTTVLVAGVSAALGAALSRALDEPVPRGEVQAPEAAVTGHPPAL